MSEPSKIYIIRVTQQGRRQYAYDAFNREAAMEWLADILEMLEEDNNKRQVNDPYMDIRVEWRRVDAI